MPKLTYVVGGETRTVDVTDSCSIGSLAGNTIVIDAAEGVSRRHASIVKLQSGFEISDLGSTNGTKVNGSLVKKHKLASGDRIEIGKAVLKWEDAAAAAVEEEISLEEPAGAGAPAASSGPARPGSGGGATASDQCVLVYAGGAKDGQKVPLDKPRITFGRNAKNTVTLTDAGASGFHAEIAREGGTFVLRDLGSTNGTLVDGEPVSETAIQHGARIRMGNTRFVFVDPTVSDFEKAMAAVDDLGSEWGMLRAEMDMTRVQQARRSQAVMIVALLVIVGGGAAYVATHMDQWSQKTQIATVEGNKIANPSFEDGGGAGWAPRPATPTKARVADKSDGAAKQGLLFYAVARDGQGGTCAAAQSAVSPRPFAAFTALAGSTVSFGASARTTGGASAGVRVVWLDRPDAPFREVGRSSSPLVTGADWQTIKAAAVTPDGARAARIEIINAGGGTAYFDDVWCIDGGDAGGARAKDGALSLVTTNDGQTTVARNETRIFGDGAVVGGALRTDSVDDPSRRGDRSGSQTIGSVRGSGAEISVDGRLVDPNAAEMSDFKVTFKATGGRYLDIQAKLSPPDAAWVASLPDEFVAGGIGVRTENDFRRAGDPHLFDKVQEVGFGGQHRFKVTRAEGCGPLRMALYKVGDSWEIAFGAADGNLAIRIDTDSQKLDEDIQNLRRDADTAKQQRKFGVAIGKLKQLAGNFAAGDPQLPGIEAEIAKLEGDASAQFERLERRVSGASEFSDAEELATAVKDGTQLAGEFEGHPVAERAKAQANAAALQLGKIRLAGLSRRAGPVLRTAQDFARQGKKALARSYFEDIIERFPGTDAEKTAREALEKL